LSVNLDVPGSDVVATRETPDVTSVDIDPTTGSSPADRRTSIWRNRDYLLLWSGQMISVSGSQVSQIALPLLVLSITRSAAQTGIMYALRMAPYLLLSLPAGALVDRWNRKRVMIVCDLARACLLASVPISLVTGHITMPQLYVVAVVEGTFYVFFSLSNTAALPQVVGKEQLPAASAQNEVVYQISSLTGPLLGAILFGLARAAPFVIDTVSYLASVASLTFMKTPFQEVRDGQPGDVLTQIREGLAWLWNQPLVRLFAILGSVLWLMFATIPLMIIILARGQHASPSVIGSIFFIGAIGGLLGASTSNRLHRLVGFRAIVMGCPWLMVLLWPLYTVAPNAVALGAVTAGLYFVFPVYNVAQMSYRLSLIPDHLQGRVNSVFRLISFAGQPIGTTVAGVLIEVIGAHATIFVLLISPILMGVLAATSPDVRHAATSRSR
jgi:MFS family permease